MQLTSEERRARIEALAQANLDSLPPRAAVLPHFQHRAFSDRVIRSLAAGGIDAPERLLFMDAEELRRIPGIGPGAMREIEAYRSRFIPPAKATKCPT